jgi:hypothetical protein
MIWQNFIVVLGVKLYINYINTYINDEAQMCIWQIKKVQTYKYSKIKQDLLLYAFFWVITRRMVFICRRFGTLCPIFIGR